MNKTIRWMLCAAGILWGATFARAAEGERLFHVENRLSVGYDDNIYLTETNETDSITVTEDVTLSADRKLERGFWNLRYRTLYTVFDDREDDKNDWDHYLDAVLNWDASPRVNLGLVDSFVYRDSSEVFGADGTLRQGNDTYYYNTVNGTVSTVLTPTMRTDFSGRYQLLRYDEENLADREDYDIYAAGVTLRNQQTASWAWFGEFRYETQDYTGAGKATDTPLNYYGTTEDPNVIPDRGFDTYSLGAGLDQILNPRLNGTIRGGYMLKNFTAANTEDDSSPYAEALLTYASSEVTRFSLSAAYSLYQSSILTFSGQDRLSMALSLSHELTAKISGYAGVTYIDSKYTAENSVDTVDAASVSDGSEDGLGAYVRLAYRLNRSNWLEAGFRTTDFSSDFQQDYTQNLFDLAWKTRL